MLRRRNSLPILAGLGVWLAIVSILLYTNLASAQQTSTDSLTAEVGDSVIELRWDAVPGAVSYAVHAWWADDPGWQRLDDGGVTGTAYTHSNPTLGRTYWYSVCPVDGNGDWGDCAGPPFPSATVSAADTPTPTHTPTATPTTSASSVPVLTAQAGAGVVELRWNAVSDAVSYAVYAWWGEDPGWQRLDDGGVTGTAYTHSNPTLGRTYWYSVCPVDDNGVRGDCAGPPLPVRDRVRGRYTHANAHGHASTRGHSNSNADSHSHSNTDYYAHASTGGHSNTDSHSNTDYYAYSLLLGPQQHRQARPRLHRGPQRHQLTRPLPRLPVQRETGRRSSPSTMRRTATTGRITTTG